MVAALGTMAVIPASDAQSASVAQRRLAPK
jgi:hypothetical protein